MAQQLGNHKIAILVENGFEQVEMTEPKQALEQAGAKTEVISPVSGKVKGWQHDHWGDEFPVDRPVSEARAGDYDALLLPGGVMNPDKLRRNEHVMKFVREFFDAGKPVAAICHGPWTLIDAGVASGRRITSWPSLQSDLQERRRRVGGRGSGGGSRTGHQPETGGYSGVQPEDDRGICRRGARRAAPRRGLKRTGRDAVASGTRPGPTPPADGARVPR